jgi:hypothetical protein
VPDDERVTAGYSSTPQSRKLGLKAGMRLGFVAAPPGWQLVDPPPTEPAEDGPADVLLWFVRSADELAGVAAHGERIFPAGVLWIAWPRRAGGHTSDITDNVIREAVLPLGLVDVKVAAIDEDWSGLKIVWRVENRASRL